MKRNLFILALASVSLAFLIFFLFFSFNDGKLHFVVCDVGQGDAIFIRTPKQHDILIDGGPDKSVLDCLSRHMPFWDRSLDLVILTHPDADHATGLVDVIERYNIRYLLTQPNPGRTEIYEHFTNVLAEKNLSAKYVKRGDGLKFSDGTYLKILWPASNQPDPIAQNSSNISLNRYSVISLLKFGQFEALLAADASVGVQEQTAEAAGDVDTLKVPHHGSKTGMSDVYLNLVKPEVGIISVGKNNRYGHPAKLSLDLLEKHKVKTLRTDKSGDIKIVSDGSTYYVEIKNKK